MGANALLESRDGLRGPVPRSRRAARYQVIHDTDYIAREAHSFEEDGVKRPRRNPRLNSIAREIPRGRIATATACQFATSSWAELEKHRAEYEALGISLDTCCSRFDTRYYPFGSAAAHIVGDLRTGENFHATNASLVEHDSNSRLQGYEFAELAPLARYRHQPGNPDIARVLARDRGVHLTLDIACKPARRRSWKITCAPPATAMDR